MSASNDREAQKAAHAEWQRQVKGALTRNEWEVVKLVARGLTNPEIAEVTFKGRATIKTYVQTAIKKLEPFATRVGILSMSRVSLAVVCVRAGQAIRTPCPPRWAIAFDQSLAPSDRVIAKEAAEAESDQELIQRLAQQGLGGQLEAFYRKVEPFQSHANVERLDREGVVEMFVQAGTVVNPAMYGRWRTSVDALVSQRQCDVLKWLARGLENQEIAVKLGLAPLTIKSHLRHVTIRLGPYAPMVGVERPGNRAGLAVIAILAGLDRRLDQ